jgi:hypothetical protein
VSDPRFEGVAPAAAVGGDGPQRTTRLRGRRRPATRLTRGYARAEGGAPPGEPTPGDGLPTDEPPPMVRRPASRGRTCARGCACEASAAGCNVADRLGSERAAGNAIDAGCVPDCDSSCPVCRSRKSRLRRSGELRPSTAAGIS